jgi:hypothetical protein
VPRISCCIAGSRQVRTRLYLAMIDAKSSTKCQGRAMPIFNVAAPDAKLRLVNQSKGFQQRAVYRDHLSQLNEGMSWEIQPEGDESLRKLKVNVRRSANELNLNIRYGATAENTLLVWKEAPSERKGSRGRPRKNADAS